MVFQRDCQNQNSNQIKVFKLGCQKHFMKSEKMKNTKSKIKSIKTRKQPGTTYCFGCKDYMQNFRPEKVKMTNKEIKFHCVVCRSNKLKLFKTKNKLTTNVIKTK